MRKLAQIAWLTALASVLALAACTSSPPNPNPRAAAPLQLAPVDLPRYMGRWYVIANIPYFAEKEFVGSYAEWKLRADGKIDDAYIGQKHDFDHPVTRHQFVDSVVPGTGNAKWSVQLFWPIHVTQLTLYVDPGYRYTILGYPGKSLGWIFSRSPDMSDATYHALLGRLDAMGYDTSQFKRVAQRPEQIGLPGFQSAGDVH